MNTSIDRSINRKICTVEEIAKHAATLKSDGCRVVHCHGVFDLLHIGHLRHLTQAKAQGEVLVVTVTPDKFVNKGPHRPAFPEIARAEMLAAFSCLGFVAINQWPTAAEAIRLIRPNVFCKGVECTTDVTNGAGEEEAAVREVGGRMHFTTGETYSSSALINAFMPSVNDDAAKFLSDFKTRHSADELCQWLDTPKDKKVLVVGETIIDEYHYVRTLGKAGKEPILAVQHEDEEEFDGGVVAIKRHAANFSDHAIVLSRQLVVKRRYVERYPLQKMFEVYFVNKPSGQWLDNPGEQDVVIVADYGHGMIDKRIAELLCELPTTLCVNTQANAGNHGFHTITKYPRADYVCLSEGELRLEARDREEDLPKLMQRIAEKMHCRRMTVTMGNRGLICWEPGQFVHVPAFTNHVVDRVGAGDAVLAITSLLLDAPLEVAAMIGSAVGAMAVGIVGNAKPIEKVALQKFLITLMK